MKQIALTIEQMQTLKGLGVDTSKASAYYIYLPTSNAVIDNTDEINETPTSFWRHNPLSKSEIPAFTLQDILEILPTTIVAGTWSYDLTSDLKNHIAYLLNDELFSDEDEFLHTETGENLLDIAYRMLVWVIQNGYLKTNKE